MRKSILITLLCIMLVVFSAGCFGSKTESGAILPGKKDTCTTAVENYLEDCTKMLNFSGSVLVADKGQILIQKGYGMACNEKNIKNSPDTIFRIGSITKQFTAMCILILEERGLLKTTDTLDKYLPGFPEGDKITIHNLVTQTSGLAEYITSDNILTADHYFSPMDIINSVKDKPLDFEPNSEFRYCNTNYIILGYIIEKASGMKYEDFLRENIFAPLDMKNTDYGDNEGSPDRAAGYIYTDGVLKDAAYIDMSFAYSAGAIQSTTGDLYKWDQALYTEKLVKKTSLSRMFVPYKNNYAYGLYISNPDIMWHGGNINGFSSVIYRDTKLQRTIIILSNREHHDVVQMLNEIIAIFNINQ